MKQLNSQKMHLPLALLALAAPTADAFSVVSQRHRYRHRHSITRVVSRPQHECPNNSVRLSAIIYGWDEDETEEKDQNSNVSYQTNSADFEILACSTEGTALAEALAGDPNKMGSLARLAAAFSPPERGIGLKDIERVQVVCVRDDQIELEAMLCETHGCVSLSVPIKFPKECGSDGTNQWLEGCVLSNLESLDTNAQTTLISIDTQAQLNSDVDLEELCLLNEKVEYPNWWIPPECDASLVGECENIRQLLNENEFLDSIVALAQDGLQHASSGTLGGIAPNYDGVVVKKARVALVGPAGVCLKVGADTPGRLDLTYMDVVYPFGGEPVKDVVALRAAVLGAVASAEEKRPSHIH